MIRITESVNRKRIQAGQNPVLGAPESSLTTHNYPAAHSQDSTEADQTTDLFNSTQMIPAVDLMSRNELGDDITQIKTRGIVQFVIMEYDMANDKWEVPNIQDFHDLLAALECDMLNNDAPFQRVMKWNNQWGNVGVIGLTAKSVPKLKQFRDNLLNFRFQGRFFTSVLKESVAGNSGITVLLRNNLRGYDLGCFSRALMRDNP